MNLYTKIKEDQLNARKNKQAEVAAVLSVLLSTADAQLISRKEEKEQNDLMNQIVLTYEKQLLKAINSFPDLEEKYKNELNVISIYLPKKLTVEETAKIINDFGDCKLGDLMKHFNTYYKGQFDPKLVQEIFAG